MSKNRVVDMFSQLITAAFGFVAGLAWNSAVQSLFAQGGPLYFIASYGVWLYAIFVTILAVFVIYYVGKIAER